MLPAETIDSVFLFIGAFLAAAISGAAVFLSLGLPPIAYIASEATTALSLHAVKLMILPAQLW